MDFSKVPLPHGLKQAYLRANTALYTALYTNDKVAQHVLAGIQSDPQFLVGSIVRMSAILFQQINAQLKFVKATPQIVLPFAKDIVAHVTDLAVQVKKIQITPQQEQAALSATLETVMHMCGVTKQQTQNLATHAGHAAVQDGLAKYHAHIAATKGATPPHAGGAQVPGNQAPPTGGQPANGGPPPAGGAGAPPGGPPAGGPTAPAAGSPVTAAPGPGQSAPPGGMLSQAANQPPAGG